MHHLYKKNKFLKETASLVGSDVKLLFVILSMAAIFLWLPGVLVANFSSTNNQTAVGSSELGIYNTSPIGEIGGRSIPASCPSDLHDAPSNYGASCGTRGYIQCDGSCSEVCTPLEWNSSSCNRCQSSGMGWEPTCTDFGSGGASWCSCSSQCTGASYNACMGIVDGGWSDWSACSATACGTTGTQTRTCTKPSPASGGSGCSGPSSQSCSTPSCSSPSSCGGNPPADYGKICPSKPNSCGQTLSGQIGCDGTCSSSPPPDSSCTCSASNKCGMTNTRTITSGGGPCLVSPPPDSACNNTNTGNNNNNNNNQTSCSRGYVLQNGRCVVDNSCPSGFTRSRFNGQCERDIIRSDDDDDEVSVPIIIPVTITSFKASFGRIISSSKTTLFWQSTNATTCSISGVTIKTGRNIGSTSGGKDGSWVTPKLTEDTKFTLNCTNNNSGSDTRTLTIKVLFPTFEEV